ncbi:hypothetical protein [Flammeovirga kamogawensis]|uniref:Uncharacterized protein n=1 Tax=Flammeovirga kamogawensis TaxID=373891 RepID=A0ABX8GQZ8_9BACT|nr:hypothetical protein [Flammeovirga kamogawensis]MBB6462120.1 hypothetical protein [Flammeovirga kamogawensis]QWG05854.1 hypothetical protein KM029_10765 [Flammeovirga kamogawensis]TRX67678.1 hypothetical protein EO216_05775 [Flammeovirga kamogawensis]
MLAGHFSTALIANKQSYPKGTFLYFLIASQLQDLLWFLLHYLGIEVTEPSDVFNATLNNMTANMLFSHDLLPQMFWLILVFAFGRLYFKSAKIGLIGSAIVAGHFILDFFSGYPHHVFGEDSSSIGLGLYISNVYSAIAIEAVFCIVVLWYFFSQEVKEGVHRSTVNKIAIIGLFIFGIGFMLTIATTSFREWFSIPNFNLAFNSNVPTLIITYFGMIFYLNYFVRNNR